MRFTKMQRFGMCLGVVAGLAMAASVRAEEEGFKPLFNGKDLSGFKFFLTEKGANPEETWSVKDEAIICSGKPNGYFYTDKGFSDYVLQYDWRYPEGSKPSSNSGCLVHIQTPHKVWPQSVEPQGRYQDHGKLFMIGIPKDKVEYNKFDQEALNKVRKPMGEWNTTEITCAADGTVTVKVNGTEVSSGKTNLKEGPIGWQSEGAEIHFRNIKIKEKK